MESQSDSDDSIGNDDTGEMAREPRSSLIEEYSTQQQEFEAAVAETQELKQQLDEAGRMGLELYEANAKLKEEAEEMEGHFLELEKSLASWKSRALHSEKQLKVYVGQLEDSENQIQELETLLKKSESIAHEAEKDAAEKQELVNKDKKMLIKNRFKISALKATMTVANLKHGFTHESHQDFENLQKRNHDLEATVEKFQQKIAVMTKEKMALRGKAASAKSELKEEKIVREELIEEKVMLEDKLQLATDECERLRSAVQRLEMEAQSMLDSSESTRIEVENALHENYKANPRRRDSTSPRASRSNGSPTSNYAAYESESCSDDELQDILRHKREIILVDADAVGTPPPFDTSDTKRRRQSFQKHIINENQKEFLMAQVNRLKLTNAIKERFTPNDLQGPSAINSVVKTTSSTEAMVDVRFKMSKLSNAIKNRFKNQVVEKARNAKVATAPRTQNRQETTEAEIRGAHMKRFKLFQEIKNHRLASTVGNDGTGSEDGVKESKLAIGSSHGNTFIEENKSVDTIHSMDDDVYKMIQHIEDKLHARLKPIFVISPRANANRYTEYEITASYHTGHSHVFIKRYSQFDMLRRKMHRQLEKEAESIIKLPDLPPKYMSKAKSMSPKVVASRKSGLLTFLNSMVCLLEAGVSDTIEGMFWDFVEHKLERDAKGSCVYKITRR